LGAKGVVSNGEIYCGAGYFPWILGAVFERAVWIRSAGHSRGDPTVLRVPRRQ
jgi:hypothetical protein